VRTAHLTPQIGDSISRKILFKVMNIAGNIFGKFTIHQPNSSTLLIHRKAGAIVWLFMLAYFGVVTFLNLIFLCLLWETLLPRTLTCQQQQQAINCEYAISGLIGKKRLKFPIQKRRSPRRHRTAKPLFLQVQNLGWFSKEHQITLKTSNLLTRV
jgi:hypothetical protein